MTTLVFPGQGSQYIGMAKDFYDNFSKAKEVFDIIEENTRINIKKIIFENNENLLDITKYTQICIFTASISIYEVFKENFKDSKFSKINFVLGHSLGEFTALAAANVISIKDCSLILKKRGELMQDAYPENKAGMAAIIGLDCDKIIEIINNNNLDIEVANDNAPGQVVVSGIMKNIIFSEKIFKDNGARKFILLNVSSAFHSKIMKEAELKMKDELKKINFLEPSFSVISNYSASQSNDKDVLFESLSKQMSNKVRWMESIRLLDSLKEKNIIEFGPGKVLTNIIKRISKNFELFNINKIEDIEKLKNGI